jgi:hypothetical protein
MSSRRLALLLAGLSLWINPAVHAQDTFEERFFAQCPHRPPIRLHHDASLWDLHAVLYTTANLMELEVIRLADWLIDVSLPGSELRPLERAVNGLRAAYHRLGNSRPVARVGELVDACQLRELSLGDATTTYTVATGGTVSPGSGTVVRINKLVDWAQRVVGDFNELAGWPVNRPHGLIRWRLPGRLVDGTQELVTRTFHGVSVLAARTLDRSVVLVETAGEGLLRAARPSAHRDTTVFVRMPTSVYRLHELWALEHRGRIYVGTADELLGLSHAELFHPQNVREAKRLAKRPRWWDLDRLASPPSHVVLVTDRRAFAEAPKTLRAYVVPAAWIERRDP